MGSCLADDKFIGKTSYYFLQTFCTAKQEKKGRKIKEYWLCFSIEYGKHIKDTGNSVGTTLEMAR